MKKTFSTEELGSVSHATMRTEDLIPAFVSKLRSLGCGCEDCGSILKLDDANEILAEEWIVDELFDVLSDHAPEGFYFGAHEGDGADYGFWSNSEEEEVSI